jgi:hypothetical protein
LYGSVLVLFGYFGPSWQAYREALSRTIKVERQDSLAQLNQAILCYEVEYGQPPSFKDNASLVKALAGDNERHLAFLSPLPNQLNSDGELIDAQGRPYRIVLSDPKHPAILSDERH